MPKIFNKQYEICTFDVNVKNRLNLSKIMEFFGDASIIQSDELGVNFSFLRENNYAWVLFKWDIHIERYPKFGEKISVMTMPYSFKKFYAFRIFEMRDSGGNLLAKATSLWMLIDSEKRKTMKIPESFYEMYGLTAEDNKKVEISKIQQIKQVQIEKEFDVRHSDIDFNEHVNNVVYASWILETIPLDITNNYSLENIKITYEKEAVLGEKVIIQTEIIEEDNKVIGRHRILNGEETLLTLVETVWINAN